MFSMISSVFITETIDIFVKNQKFIKFPFPNFEIGIFSWLRIDGKYNVKEMMLSPLTEPKSVLEMEFIY